MLFRHAVVETVLILMDRGALEQGEHLSLGRRTQYMALGERRRLRIIGGADSLSCGGEVVWSMLELDVGTE